MSRHFYGDIDIALVAFGGRRGGSLQQNLDGTGFCGRFLGCGTGASTKGLRSSNKREGVRWLCCLLHGFLPRNGPESVDDADN